MSFEKYFRDAVPVTWEPAPPPLGTPGAAVIPVLGELETLPELLASPVWRRIVPVLVVNQSADSPKLYCQQNAELLSRLRRGEFPGVYWLDFTAGLPGGGGVGGARKIGMDATLAALGTDIVLFSLDGDTMIEPNYADAVLAEFSARPELVALTIDFSHVSDDPALLAAARKYEHYLHNYRDGLARAGSPYAYIPLGSALAVRGAAYLRSGGMRRREGGEDFYFLQAVRKLGEIGELHTTRVYPSARPSDRVPFGTGPRVRRIIAENGIDCEPDWVFDELAAVLSAINRAGDCDELAAPAFPARSAAFFDKQNFPAAWRKIIANTPRSPERLKQAFAVWFDAFRTLKLIHFLLQQDHRFSGDSFAAPGKA
ncbi:MAG: hypothetical protein PHI85_01355 [Victivallaceae bacterium]|nr:hypothetical protein [Victivallaceae bacterium]